MKKLKKYYVYMDDGHDCFKVAVPALNEKDARIAFLEKNMEETVKILKDKEKIIENMENSLSWKVTKPLRNIRKKGEKNEN